MQNFSAFPYEMFASLWRNRSLIRALIKREVLGRYKHSYIGVFWAVLNPILMLVIYTFIFTSVFSAKWGKNIDSTWQFSLVLFLGLIVFNIFSECVTNSPNVISANVNYVTKVVFPLEVLPIVGLGGALFHASLNLLVWYVAYIFIIGEIPLGIIFLPIYILPFVFFCVGISWLLSALGVYIRDLVQITGPIVTALMFLSPIFYPLEALPPKVLSAIKWNPLTLPIENTRNLLLWDTMPELNAFLIELLLSFGFACFCFWVFQRLRKGFADCV